MVMTYKNVASSLVAAAVVRVRPKLKYRNLATRPDSMLNRKDLQDVAAMVRGCKGGAHFGIIHEREPKTCRCFKEHRKQYRPLEVLF